jgi:PPM family protein phosphatase
MTLALRSVVRTDVGLCRENNEDSAHAGSALVAVADGVGGLPAGELASSLLIDELAPLDRSGRDDPLADLADALERTSAKIRVAGELDASRTGMGTTVSALLLRGDRLGLLHVGDSRAYRWRGRTLTALTRDDTLVQSLIDGGVLTAEEARVHPHRSLVTQVVTGEPVSPVFQLLTPMTGDRYLLCSDGLTDVIRDETISRVLGAYPDPGRCADRLIDLALRAGAPDNVTVIVADIAGDTD